MTIDELILKAVKAETIVERTEALAELKDLVIVPLQKEIAEQKEMIAVQNKQIDNTISELKVKNNTIEKQSEAIKENSEKIVELSNDIKTKKLIIDDLSNDNAKKRGEVTKLSEELKTTKDELDTEKTKKSIVEDRLDFFGAFSILEVNTKFNIPSGKLMKWAKKNKYVASLKAEVLDAGKEYFTVINKAGFASIGVTPQGAKFIKDNLAEIVV